MATMRSDYKVGYLSEESIAQITLARRTDAGQRNSTYFNIVKYVEHLERTWRKKGKFSVRFFDATDNQKPAYVTFAPPTMHVDREVWKLAEIGEPDARFIVAHELGHLFLHDHHAKAFSDDPAERITYADQGHSAEWQANTFAAHFLLPDHIVSAHYDAKALAASCSVNKFLADERLDAIIDRDRRRRNSGICSTCGDFTLNSDGVCSSKVCSGKIANYS